MRTVRPLHAGEQAAQANYVRSVHVLCLKSFHECTASAILVGLRNPLLQQVRQLCDMCACVNGSPISYYGILSSCVEVHGTRLALPSRPQIADAVVLEWR
jgi:hypothetical protein